MAGVLATLLVLAGCGIGVNTYGEFRGAVKSGASCEQLFDIRANFDSATDLERIDGDLRRIGCDSPGAVRTGK